MKTAWKGFGQYLFRPATAAGNTYNNEYDIFTYGAGYLDIDAALEQYGSGERASAFPDRGP